MDKAFANRPCPAGPVMLLLIRKALEARDGCRSLVLDEKNLSYETRALGTRKYTRFAGHHDPTCALELSRSQCPKRG